MTTSIYISCDCGNTFAFNKGFIPEKFYCGNCEKEYLAKDIFKKLKLEGNNGRRI